MKKINFEELMASVSEQFVEEAASFSPIKAFNTRFVALAACIAIIVTAIPAVVILNREKDVDAPKVTTPVENIVVTPGGEETDKKNTNVIYVDSNLMNEAIIKQAYENQEVEVLSLSDYKKYHQDLYLPGRKVEPDINVPKELNVATEGVNIKATLKSVYYTASYASTTDKALKSNNKIAEYTITSINGKSTDDEYLNEYNQLYYNVTAKEIIGLKTWYVPHETQVNLPENKILEIAQKDAAALYGKDFIEKYSVEIISNYNAPGVLYDGGYSYCVNFRREICGIEADDSVSFGYNGAGKLYDIYSNDLNSFDFVESKLTQGMINEVEERAIIILDGRLVKNRLLNITTDGRVYVYYTYYLREGDKRFSYNSVNTGSVCLKINMD